MYSEGFTILSSACAVLLATQNYSSLLGTASAKASTAVNPKYLAFRNNWLAVHLLNMMGDWLQGPYMYALYRHYGYSVGQIAQLYVCGFLSSAIFGTLIGSLADNYGRKRLCLTFAVIYSLSCATMLSPNFAILLFGRLLGGISTSLVYSAFESWMVSEHNNLKFSSQDLSNTFGVATFANGFVAIVAGMVANWAVDSYGLTAPFMISAGHFIVAAAVVQMTWKENYGTSGAANEKKGAKKVADNKGMFGPLMKGFHLVSTNSLIFITGMTQSLFEGSMYTFVFMWSVALEAITTGADDKLPYGVIFSSFMVSIMLGSQCFSMLKQNNWSPDAILVLLLGVAFTSFALMAAFAANATILFWAFNLFEFTCGMYFPTMGILRSQSIPEEVRTSVSNIFRIPLNFIVVVVLLQISKLPLEIVFSICAGLIVTALVLRGFIGVSKKQQ